VNIRSNSAFIRGEGTWFTVRRVMAETRAGFSCTKPFHHRGHRGHRVKPEVAEVSRELRQRRVIAIWIA
jgi:hypothetical protein